LRHSLFSPTRICFPSFAAKTVKPGPSFPEQLRRIPAVTPQWADVTASPPRRSHGLPQPLDAQSGSSIRSRPSAGIRRNDSVGYRRDCIWPDRFGSGIDGLGSRICSRVGSQRLGVLPRGCCVRDHTIMPLVDRGRVNSGCRRHRQDVRHSHGCPDASNSTTALREAYAGQQSQQHPTNEHFFIPVPPVSSNVVRGQLRGTHNSDG